MSDSATYALNPYSPNRQALRLFNQAQTHGWLHRLWAWLRRRSFRLQDFDELLAHSELEHSRYAGLQTVDIDDIRGTQGKADAFDAEFNPIRETTRSRWIGVAIEKMGGRDLPPVDLVKVNDVYYVRDGHHRISVARNLGQSFVEAEVIEMQMRQCCR
jgi:hypothetical protein